MTCLRTKQTCFLRELKTCVVASAATDLTTLERSASVQESLIEFDLGFHVHPDDLDKEDRDAEGKSGERSDRRASVAVVRLAKARCRG